MSDSQIMNILLQNQDYLHTSDIIENILREIGWFIVKILKIIASAGESLYEHSFKILDITRYDKVMEFFEKIMPIVHVVLFASLIFLGVRLIIGSEKKSHKILMNFLIMIIFISVNISGLHILSDLTQAVKSDIEGVTVSDSKSDDVYSLIDTEIIDILKVDGKYGFANLDLKNNKEQKRVHPAITKENFSVFEPNMKLNYESDLLSTSAKEVLKKQVTFGTGENGSEIYALTDVNNGVGWNSGDDDDIFNNFYYRYDINFLNIIILLISVALIYLTMAYKNVRIGFELLTSYSFAIFYAADINNGERIRKILSFIRDTYILFISNIVAVKLFFLFKAFLMENFEGSIGVIFLFFLSFCLMDGANIVQRILGLDAGLSSTVGKMFALYGAGKAASKAMFNSLMFAKRGAEAGASKVKKSLSKDDSKSSKDKIKDKFDKAASEGEKDKNAKDKFEEAAEKGNDKADKNKEGFDDKDKNSDIGKDFDDKDKKKGKESAADKFEEALSGKSKNAKDFDKINEAKSKDNFKNINYSDRNDGIKSNYKTESSMLDKYKNQSSKAKEYEDIIEGRTKGRGKKK